MKRNTKLRLILFFFLFGFRIASAQYAIGDYGSLSSGNWNGTIWGTWNGAGWTAVGTFPSSSKNTFILAGTTVNVPTGGPWSCQDLTVEAGSKLWTTNSGTNVYIYVYGFNFICNGQIGDGANFDGISFGIEGTNCTISGNGLFDSSRMRKNLTTPITNLIINMNINLRWNAGSGTQLYNAANNTNFNVTINPFCTVNLVPNGPNIGNICIDGLDGTGVALEAGGTYTINGTLIISGKLYLTTNNTNTVYGCSWIINGLVQATEIVASNSGFGGHGLYINSGGKLDITGTAAFSSLGVTNNSYTFNLGSTVEYSAAGTQIVRVKSEFAAVPTVSQEYGNLILSNSGLKSTTLSGLYVKNDLTISGAAVLDPNPTACLIFLGGNWLNYNATGFAEKTTTVYINGGGIQTISCPGGEVYNILRYQKSGSFLQFNNPVDVINQLVFASAGYVDLNSNALTVRNSLTTGIAGASNSRYILSEKTDNSSKIIWKINTGTGTYTFPFGIPPGLAANYIPVVVSKTSATSIGDLSIATYGTPPDNLPWPTTPTNVTNLRAYFGIYNAPDNRHWTVDRYWEIGSTSPTPLNSLTFNYRTSELPDLDPTPTNLAAQFWAGAFSVWNLIQYGTGVANNVTVPTFSYYNTSWTLTSLTSPLPIELLSFTGSPEENSVRLNWETSAEINNDFFTVEKSNGNGEFFEIGILNGAGNSTTKNEYKLSDSHPFSGINYYRLKQTDFDGKSTYSDVVAVDFKKGLTNFSVFPNPAFENAFLINEKENEAEVFIRTVSGKLVNHLASTGKNKTTTLSLSDLPQGIYVLEIKSENETQFLRLIKQ